MAKQRKVSVAKIGRADDRMGTSTEGLYIGGVRGESDAKHVRGKK